VLEVQLRVFLVSIRQQKNQHTLSNKSPERLALNSRFHFLSGTSRGLGLAPDHARTRIKLGKACYVATTITQQRSVKQFTSALVELNDATVLNWID
jgi:hypothetical protein